jgi:hypothetical protein
MSAFEGRSRSTAILSDRHAGVIAGRIRDLRNTGYFSTTEAAFLETLLWKRPKGLASVIGWTYKRFRALTRFSYDAMSSAISKAASFGFLIVRKRFLLIEWANGGKKWRQSPNEYTFIAPANCDSTEASGDLRRKKVRKINEVTVLFVKPELPAADVQTAQNALRARADHVMRVAMEERLKKLAETGYTRPT